MVVVVSVMNPKKALFAVLLHHRGTDCRDRWQREGRSGARGEQRAGVFRQQEFNAAPKALISSWPIGSKINGYLTCC